MSLIALTEPKRPGGENEDKSLLILCYSTEIQQIIGLPS